MVGPSPLMHSQGLHNMLHTVLLSNCIREGARLIVVPVYFKNSIAVPVPPKTRTAGLNTYGSLSAY